jgi:hypothetical protein
MGHQGYQGFLKHVLRLKEEFYTFYVIKCYRENKNDSGSVESMIEGRENLYSSRSALPAGYLNSIGTLLAYLILTALAGLLGLKKILKRESKQEIVRVQLEQMETGKTYYCHYKGNGKKEGLIEFLKSKKGVVVKTPPKDGYHTGTNLKTWLDFEIRSQCLDRKLVEEILETVQITSGHLKQEMKHIDIEDFHKSYLALQIAKNANLYVFVDFLDRASRELEFFFRKAIDIYMPYAVIIYFSNRMFEIVSNETNFQQKDCSHFLAIDLNMISLR